MEGRGETRREGTLSFHCAGMFCLVLRQSLIVVVSGCTELVESMRCLLAGLYVFPSFLGGVWPCLENSASGEGKGGSTVIRWVR